MMFVRRFSSTKSIEAKKAAAEEEEKSAQELFTKIKDTIKFKEVVSVGSDLLSSENVKLLSKHNKLVFWDVFGKTVQGNIAISTPARREDPKQPGLDKLIFRLQPETALTVGINLLQTFRTLGVESGKVSIHEVISKSTKARVTVGVPEVLAVGVSANHDELGKQLFEQTIQSPNNFFFLRSELDHAFIEKYCLTTLVEQTLGSYDNFLEGKCKSLSSRTECMKYAVTLERDTSGTLDVRTHEKVGKVGVSVTASRKETIQTKVEVEVTFLDENHALLKEMREEKEKEKKKAEAQAKEDEQKTKDAQLELKRQEEFKAKEEQCKNDLVTMFSNYRKEMHNELERLAKSSWLWSLVDSVVGGDTDIKRKHMFIVGPAGAGKSTLVWCMSILGEQERMKKSPEHWKSMDDWETATRTRRPTGLAEASKAIERQRVCVLEPEKNLMAFAVDIQGEVHELEDYNPTSSDQLTVLVVPAKTLFTPDGEFIPNFQNIFNRLPFVADAKVIVVTKWDELKFGKAKDAAEVIENVNKFWMDVAYRQFAEECAEKLKKRTNLRTFAFRMPIRGEGRNRSWQTLYQICSGTKDVMLYLVRQMK